MIADGRELSLAVLVTAYNRPEKLRRVLDHLSRMRGIRLYVACDGPRGEEDAPRVVACRDIAREFVCDKSRLRLRQTNLGCCAAMFDAISWFFGIEAEGVINEDDVLLDESFLKAVNLMLPYYRSDRRVYHINAYVMPEQYSGECPFFIGSFVSSWGWATWSDRWSSYRHNIELSGEGYRAIARAVGYNSTFIFFVLALLMTRQGKYSSWAYRWTYSVWLAGGGGLTPRRCLCEVFGFGEGATHTSHVTHVVTRRGKLDAKELGCVERYDERQVVRDILVQRAVSRSSSIFRLARMLISAIVPNAVFREIRTVFR